MCFDKARRLYLHCTDLSSRHFHRLPVPLQSYLESSPFTLTVPTVFDLAFLGLFAGSKITWAERFTAIRIFQTRGYDEASRTATKRVFFSLIWTQAAQFVGAKKVVWMGTWMCTTNILSLIAIMPAFLAKTDMDAVDLAVKAWEMGDERGEPVGVLGDVVSMPAEWRERFKAFGVSHACWIHAMIVGYSVYSQEVVRMSLNGRTHLIGQDTSDEKDWGQWLPTVSIRNSGWISLYALPLAFVCSLLLGLFAMRVSQNTPQSDSSKRVLSAFFASVWFAFAMNKSGIGCNWSVWLASDAVLWAVDECWSWFQKRQLWGDFDGKIAEWKNVQKK